MSIGFNQGLASPCLFFRPERNVRVFIHGDDYVSSGHSDDLVWLGKELSKAFECKISIMGPEEQDQKEIEVLNRWLTWSNNEGHHAITYEADPKHAEIIIQELGMNDAKELATPIARLVPVKVVTVMLLALTSMNSLRLPVCP